MSATFKLAKQKQNDLRRLMNEQKSKQHAPVIKIDSPLAKYPFQISLLLHFEFHSQPNELSLTFTLTKQV